MDSNTVWQHIDSERTRLADLLESLPPAAWEQPSLCRGWSVRDVGAHLSFAQARVRDVMWPAVRAGFRYNVLAEGPEANLCVELRLRLGQSGRSLPGGV